MATGWLKEGKSWYWLTSSGAMAVGWANVRGTWYYMGGSGAMLSGWQRVNGSWYYLDPASGAMAKNKWVGSYYVGSSGRWVPGY